MGYYQLPIDTYSIYLTVFCVMISYLAATKSVSARSPVRPEYDDKYRSRSDRFVERQDNTNNKKTILNIKIMIKIIRQGHHHNANPLNTFVQLQLLRRHSAYQFKVLLHLLPFGHN